jgi:hypothetical protein
MTSIYRNVTARPLDATSRCPTSRLLMKIFPPKFFKQSKTGKFFCQVQRQCPIATTDKKIFKTTCIVREDVLYCVALVVIR